MILITKGGLSRGGDNEMPENCLYDCRLRDTCIYVPRWADEETLLRIGTERSKSCPLVQVYEVPKETTQGGRVKKEARNGNFSLQGFVLQPCIKVCKQIITQRKGHNNERDMRR